MENERIVSLIKDTASLLALHGANAFQVRYYVNAAICLEKVTQHVAGLSLKELSRVEGMIPSTVKLVHEFNTTGTLQRWKELIAQTPAGLWELLGLQGIGPKKLRAIWQKLGIDNPVDLLIACEENKLVALPGFGSKTQATIKASLAFRAQHRHLVHYATALPQAKTLLALFQQHFPNTLVTLAGAIRRKMEVVSQIDILVGTEAGAAIMAWLDQQELLQKDSAQSDAHSWQGKLVDTNLRVIIRFCANRSFYQQLLLQTGSERHLALVVDKEKTISEVVTQLPEVASEAAAYAQINLPYIPPELREGRVELSWARDKGAPALLEMKDLKGVFHSHTTASDGKDTLEAMVQQCRTLGYSYLGISDHSQSAIYAGGLKLDAIQKQHGEVERLSLAYPDFKIFKGIESDVLKDGTLDYSHEILCLFDFVIASVHTGMKMDKHKATDRVIKAVSNPHTTMLAHLTNRLLLRREGFPVDHKAVIDACASYGVIIELNANPWRLELDWRWIDYALSQNVWISINPDAHNKESIENMYYGVCVGRKGGLTASQTFNTLSLSEVVQYLTHRKDKARNPW